MSEETMLPPSDGDSSKTGSHSEDSDTSKTDDCTDLARKNDVKIVMKKEEKTAKKKRCCGPISQYVCGVALIVMSVTGLVFTPQDFMLWEKLNMRPGFPPYEWWADPPDEVRLRAYVFNITNHERFLQGLDEKLNVQEIGPIVYLEKLLHSNIVFNENSTLTYTAKRFTIYLPEENNIDMNATLIVPNLAVLGIATFLTDSNFLIRRGFHTLTTVFGSKLFVPKTIYEYLWDYTDPVLDTSRTFAPGLVPVNNMGILARIYSDFTDEITVKIGPRWGHEHFFQIDRFRGEPQLPGYDPEICPDRIFGSTEGVMYQQRLTKNDTLLYWRKTVCKIMPLYFDSEMTIDGVPLYRYNLSESTHERLTNETDCYATEPALPDGVSDASKCYYNFPMVSSYPHFYTGGVEKDQFVTGLTPDRMKHNSYAVIEPLTGTPFQSVARMQSNLRTKDLSVYATEFDKLSNMIIPLFWGEYNQQNLPLKIKNTVYFTAVILPPLSTVLLAMLILTGFYLITKNIFKSKLRNETVKTLLYFKSQNTNNLASNSVFSCEKENFIKSPS